MLGAVSLAAASLAACAGQGDHLTVDEAADSLDFDGFLAHMEALSSDAMEGRRPGTAGYDNAAAYLIEQVQALGLEPGGVDGTYRQPITFRRARVEEGSATFSIGGDALEYGTDFALNARVIEASTQVLDAPVVFAGYGISAADMGYDDFAGIDVANKLVIVLGGAPDDFGSLERTVLTSSKTRDQELRTRGAAGIIGVQPDGPVSNRGRTHYLTPELPVTDAFSSEELRAAVVVPRSVVAQWITAAGRNLDEIEASLQAGEPQSFDLDVRASVEGRYEHEDFESANVAALLPGSDPELRDEHLVMTAHLDHLGVGIPLDGDSIYNGTLDNASGSAAILTLASALSRMEAPRRSILFLWVTAEESGLLGSEYFARFPTVEEPGRVVANQNIDGVMGMIAASTDLLAFGYEHSNLSDAVDYAVEHVDMPVSPDPTPDQNLFVRSDQYSFVRQGIAAIWVQAARDAVDPNVDAQAELNRWIVERYHKPTDDLDQPVDMLGVRNELVSNLYVTHYIANELDAVVWEPESFLYRRRPGG